MPSGEELEFERENAVIPAPLRLVRDFVNTIGYPSNNDDLATPAHLAEWLAARGLADGGAPARADHLRLARTLREGLRSVLETHAGHEPDADAMRQLDDVLAQLPVRVAFGGEGELRLSPAVDDPIRAGLAGILDAARVAGQDGSWMRLKACARSDCRWAYFDASRNRSARWCSMAGCGNTMKMRAAYAARKARAAAL